MIDRLQAHMQAMQMLMRAQQVTADNLANLNTPGFKGTRLFHRLMTEQIDGRTVTRTVAGQQVDLTQGVLEQTGNELDVGISGEGFFVVEEGGQHYLTRDGRFRFDPDGYLVNSRGARVQGSAGEIHIPEYFHAMDEEKGSVKLEIARDGTIRLNNEVFDTLRLVRVEDPSALERRGNSYLLTHAGNVREDETSLLMQGFYENGNVDPLFEMVAMMKNMQMFEAQQRAMRTTDETLAQATNNLGRF